MALVLRTDTARLVFSRDPSVELAAVYPPAAKGYWLHEGQALRAVGATVLEVRPLTGVEFAKAASLGDSAEELAYILATVVVSVDGNKAKDKLAEVASWPYYLAQPVREAVIRLSMGGDLPLVPAASEAPETA